MIRYVGAKSRLAAQIIPLFPAHRVYVEPFAGMARVAEPADVEYIRILFQAVR